MQDEIATEVAKAMRIALLGDNTKIQPVASQHTGTGYNIRDPGLQNLGNDEMFLPLQDDPRFQAFLRKMNFEG